VLILASEALVMLGVRSLMVLDLALCALPLLLLVSLLGVCVLLLARCWRAAAFCVLAALPGVFGVIGMRASRGPALAGAPIRVLMGNAHANNPAPESIARLIDSDGHDLVVLVEIPTAFALSLREQGLGDRFPHRAVGTPSAGVSQWVIALSRWPVVPFGDPADAERTGVVACVVEHPEGRFGFIGVHASSPRTREKWLAGNIAIERASRIAAAMRAEGLEVVLAGDLNGTPTGLRLRRLAREGLRTTKPWQMPGGTYPSSLPRAMRLAIDHVLITEGWLAGTWASEDLPGSDHRAVRVELWRAQAAP
jgi:endonuclease/exonuclease/phosphatase (EEP) superfamily protein YafD